MPIALEPDEATLRWRDVGSACRWEPVPGRRPASAGRAERDVGDRSIVDRPPARHDERNLDTTGNYHR
jgi:hypothetical protein